MRYTYMICHYSELLSRVYKAAESDFVAWMCNLHDMALIWAVGGKDHFQKCLKGCVLPY